MGRLTKHTPDNFGYAEYQLKHGVDEQSAISRLAAYEDTGMEPDEIVALAKGALKSATVDVGTKLYDLAVSNVFEKRYGITLDRMCELAEADKDGRCVVLPCNVGDTVYIIGLKCLMDKLPMPECSMFECENCWRNTEYEVFERKVTVGLLFKIMFDKESDLFVFGKTVFLTRPEAEAALASAKQVEASAVASEAAMKGGGD